MDPNQQVGNSSVPPAPVPGVAPQPVPPMQPAQAVPTFVAPAPDPTPTQVQIQPNNTFVNATTDLLTSSANPLAATAEPLAPSAEPVVPLAPPSLEQAPVEATPDLAALANELSSAPNLTTPPQGATDALLQTPPAENLSLTGGPEPDSPPVLTPSADLMATSTVSAVPDLNAAANELTSAPDPNASSAPEPTQTVAANASATGDFVNDPNATADQGPAKIENTDDNPLVAAAPVPGSIGSAKSYADIQREEAERTAQAAAKKQAKNKMANSLNKLKGFKMNKTTAIILIAVVALVLIGVVVGITVFSGDSNKNSSSSTTPTTPVVQTPAKLTLTCQRSLENDEMAFGSISGNQQNISFLKMAYSRASAQISITPTRQPPRRKMLKLLSIVGAIMTTTAK